MKILLQKQISKTLNLSKILKCFLAVGFAASSFQLMAAEAESGDTVVDTLAADNQIVEKDTAEKTKLGLNELLGGMGAALNSGNYQLSLVYVHDGQVDSLRLSHLTTEHDQYDMLEHLQGVPRSVVTHNGETWLYMGKEKFHVSNEEESPVIRWRRQLERLARNIGQYKVFVSGVSRVAGRLTYQINFISKDKNRHSSRLWLDVNNYLPMRLDSLDTEGKIIEQVLTVNLNYPANLTENIFQFGEAFKTSEAIELEQENPQSLWQVSWLPVGFELSSLNHHSDKGVDYEQWLYSDGLSTLSVFIESVKSEQKTQKRSFLRGDAVIFDLVSVDKRVTVVGSIPVKTAEKIASSVSVQSQSQLESTKESL